MRSFSNRKISVLLLGCFCAAIALLLASIFQMVETTMFCQPTACISGGYLGVPAIETFEHEFVLRHPKVELLISRQCSGYHFFTILLGLGVMVYAYKGKTSFIRLVQVILIAYFATIAANTFRVLTSFYTILYQPAWVTPTWKHLIHEGVGIVTFVCFLIAYFFFIQQEIIHEYRTKKTSTSAS
jgi:exosortase/archaeosortase family protein